MKEIYNKKDMLEKIKLYKNFVLPVVKDCIFLNNTSFDKGFFDYLSNKFEVPHEKISRVHHSFFRYFKNGNGFKNKNPYEISREILKKEGDVLLGKFQKDNELIDKFLN